MIRAFLLTTLCLSILTTSGLAPRGAAAATGQEMIQVQKSLEDRLASVLKQYDARALVFVRIEPKTARKMLPGTPFFVNNLSLQDSGGNTETQPAVVRILSQMTPFSNTVLGLLKEMIEKQGYKASFTVDPLPVELLQNGADAEARKLREEAEKRQEEREKAREQAAQEKWAQARDSWEGASQSLKILALGLLGVGAVLLILGVTLALSRGKGTRDLVSALGGGFQKLSDALEGGMGAGTQRREDSAPKQIAAAIPGSPASGGIHEYPKESLVACLADCYWTESDSYAAFLWKRIPADKRKLLISGIPWMAEYASSLAGVTEQDTGAIEEAYYLSPMPLSHLDDVALTEITRKNPVLFARLPGMRVAALKLSARERVVLRKAAVPSAVLTPEDFDRLSPSQLRVIRKRVPIPIRNLEEESEILALQDLTVELMEDILSLGWLALLPPEEIEKLFARMSARDLASCWIGPEKVLALLEKHLSPKKRDMMLSVQSTVAPSRESEAFSSLHQASIHWLRSHPSSLSAETENHGTDQAA